MIKDEEKLEKYINDFYTNKPSREHFNGMVPVKKKIQDEVSSSISKMFMIVKDAFEDTQTAEPERAMFYRKELMNMLKPWNERLNDCIFEANTREEGEKCAEEFLHKVLSEGFARAHQMADSLYK